MEATVSLVGPTGIPTCMIMRASPDPFPAPKPRRGRLRRWLAARLIQTVPDELAACEFDCVRSECPSDEWQSCERRLRVLEERRRHRAAP